MITLNIQPVKIFGSALVALGLLSACASPAPELGAVRFKPTPFAPVNQIREGAPDADAPAVAVIDINGDELPDVYLGRAGASDLLLVQDVAVGWRIHALNASEDAPRAALAVDVNGDFRPDLVVARASGLYLFLNRNGGYLNPGYRIAKYDREHGASARLSAGDINGDGWTDLVYAHLSGESVQTAQVDLLLNTGKPHRSLVGFSNMAGYPQTVCCGLSSVLLADINDDRWPDIVLVGRSGPSQVLENLRGESFSAREFEALRDWDNVSAADYDSDGDLDLLATRNHSGAMARLLRNDGSFAFTDVTSQAGVSVPKQISRPTWTDADADGLVDVVLSPTQWLRQVQPGHFKRLRFGFSEGVDAPDGHSVIADFDRDGFADQLIVGSDGSLALFGNEYKQNHWVAVRLRGHQNRSTLGARVKLNTRDGKTIIRHQWANSAMPSNHSDELLFGIGRRTKLSSVEIEWTTGKYTRVDDPLIDRRIGFIEPANPGGRLVALKHPLLESVKRRTSPPELVCR